MTMLSGEVSLEAEGVTYTIVLDFEALIAAEDAYGKPLAILTSNARDGFVGALRCLFYGALRRKHPDISLEAAGKLFMTNGKAVEDALERAAKLAYPEEDKKPGKAEPRRGMSSGRNGAKQV